MAAREGRILLAQHDVAVVRGVRHEERDDAVARLLFVRALRIALGDCGGVERPPRDRGCVLQKAPHRRADARRTRHEVAGSRQNAIDLLEVGVARRFGMVRLKEAEERPRRLLAGLEVGSRRLDHRTGDLVLQAFARQTKFGIDPARIPIRWAEQLHRIGGEDDGTIEATVRDPRVRGRLGKVLAARHHRAAPAMPGDAVVDVLRDIGLVAHDEAAVAETDVLHERRIAGHRPGAGVLHLHPPEPEVVARMQPERDTVPQACSLALPCEAIIRSAEAALGAGPDSFHDRRLRRAHPQVEAGDPTVDRRAMDLIDQRPPVLVLVLDRKHTTVGKDADRKARLVGDATQAVVLLPRRHEGTEGRHPLSPSPSLGRPAHRTIGLTRMD